MSNADSGGLFILFSEEPKDTFLPLVSNSGVEIMRVRLKKSDTVWVSPADDKNLMEFYCVLKGTVELDDGGQAKTLRVGDSFYTRALQRDVRVRAPEAAQLLYISSSPVFAGIRDYQEMIKRMLAPIDAKDNVTLEHSKNVMRCTVKLYDRLGSRGITMDDIVAASLFHDVGKCDTPDEILKKEGRLTSEEYALMKRHPADSYRVLSPIYGETAARIARAHHERLDGGGYPDGLKGGEIEYGARLIAVSDAFDAMTHKRPYNRVKTQREAVGELLGLGAQYDMEIVEALAELVDKGEILQNGGDAP